MMPYTPNPDRYYGLEPRRANDSDGPERKEDEINEEISELLAPVRGRVMDLFMSLPSESRRLDVMLDDLIEGYTKAKMKCEGYW